MASGRKLIWWGLALAVPINIAVLFLLASAGQGSPHGGAAWLAFLSVPGLFLGGVVMVIFGAVVRSRSKRRIQEAGR